MHPADKEERRRLVAEASRKQLAEGTWPQVMAIFRYPTPRAPRKSDNEIDLLKNIFEKADLKNMGTFVELVRLEERRMNMSMSFNFSMNRRLAKGEALTSENALAFFLCPDILVGTRGGKEGAFTWLEHFTQAMADAVPEAVQIFEKIFGEAGEILKKDLLH